MLTKICIAKQWKYSVHLYLEWRNYPILFIYYQNGETALTIAKRGAQDFYEKITDQIDKIENSKCNVFLIIK